jgi:hypothetical protein
MVAATGRALCRCADAGLGHCASERSEFTTPGCHGCADSDAESSADPDAPLSDPDAPDSDCCCVQAAPAGVKYLQVTTSATCTAALPLAAPLAQVLPNPGAPQGGPVPPLSPRDHSPPRYVVLCTFRC